MHWLLDHLVALVGMTAVLSFGAAWILKNGLPFVEKKIAELDEELLAEIKDPALKQFCLDVEAAAMKLVPDAGDAKYAVLADLFIKDVPSAAPARPLLIAVFTAIGAGAKAGIADAEKSAQNGPVEHS